MVHTGAFISTSYVYASVYFSPWRIIEDAGGAFSMGFIGGGIWHFVKGFRNSPRVIALGVTYYPLSYDSWSLLGR